MNSINKTLYIPLYGKSYVSKKGIFLDDKKAEEIWEAEGFSLKGKARSKWLAYYMGIRAAVFDDWLRSQMERRKAAIILHIGCGMDARVLRVGTRGHRWYDVDLPDVIRERKRYYEESDSYHMLAGNVKKESWLEDIPETGNVIVVLEGVSMYLTADELRSLFARLSARYEKVSILMDSYTQWGARMSRIKNPVREVGVSQVYGLDQPETLETGALIWLWEHEMTPQRFVDELRGAERFIFQKLYAGKISRKIYRMYEFEKSAGTL